MSFRAESTRNLGSGLLNPSADTVIKKFTAGLDLVKLESMICCTIPSLTGNRSGIRFRGLAHRCCGNKWASEVQEILNWLHGIVSDEASAKISSESLQHVYCYIGLIHKWQGQREDALKAMVKAAWLAQRSSSKRGTPITP
jgi:hypothetical protein